MFRDCNIIIRKNDLCKELVDAIVNPANERLEHAGGAALAICNAGGDVIISESTNYINEHGRLPTGCATTTDAGNLKCKKVIHAVGPRYCEGALDHQHEEIQMKLTINSILNSMLENKCMAVSTPAISTGIYRFPLKKFAMIFSKTVIEFVNNNEDKMKNRKIILCNFDDETTNTLLEFVPKFIKANTKDDEEKSDKEDNEKSNKNKKKHKKKSKDSDDENNDDKEVKRCKKCNSKIKDRFHQRKGENLKICKSCYDEKYGDLTKSKKNKKEKNDEEEEKLDVSKSKKKQRHRDESDEYEDSDKEENLDKSSKNKNSKAMKKKRGNSEKDESEEKVKKSKKNKKQKDSSEEDSDSSVKKDKKRAKKNRDKLRD